MAKYTVNTDKIEEDVKSFLTGLRKKIKAAL